MNNIVIPVWPHAYDQPSGQGALRREMEDFAVFETLAFEPSGEGEHAFLQIQKTGENSEYVARLLARHAGVRQRDIGYAGLKDRQAVTTQWFSVWLPGKDDPDWSGLTSENIKVLQVIRHARKLKRGVLAANHFSIRVRNWQGDVAKTTEQLEAIKQHGVPNYFGVQRFGHGGQNVTKALAVFQGAKVKRELRSIYLSAARAYLFNQVLAERVRQHNWNQALAGDAFMLDGSHSFFQSAEPDAAIYERLQANAIHPTGPLWGGGQSAVAGAAAVIEATVMEQHCEIADGLIKEKLDMARRALRVNVQDFEWQFVAADQLELSFSLPPGSFATAVLRELLTDL